MSAKIEVTNSLIGQFAHLRSLGLTWGYRVALGSEEIIGGTHTQRDAWREARAMKARLEKIQAGACSRLHAPLRSGV